MFFVLKICFCTSIFFQTLTRPIKGLLKKSMRSLPLSHCPLSHISRDVFFFCDRISLYIMMEFHG
jgi:hypothetical protein